MHAPIFLLVLLRHRLLPDECRTCTYLGSYTAKKRGASGSRAMAANKARKGTSSGAAAADIFNHLPSSHAANAAKGFVSNEEVKAVVTAITNDRTGREVEDGVLPEDVFEYKHGIFPVKAHDDMESRRELLKKYPDELFKKRNKIVRASEACKNVFYLRFNGKPLNMEGESGAADTNGGGKDEDEGEENTASPKQAESPTRSFAAAKHICTRELARCTMTPLSL
eukprot:GHVU01230476.1.p1 GENE.GHVU01230476.1~~GHVU01230476.1.p1  ORF type:complete len:224 (+),score=35.84 GHVU01230476.1:633-1304(+)